MTRSSWWDGGNVVHGSAEGNPPTEPAQCVVSVHGGLPTGMRRQTLQSCPAGIKPQVLLRVWPGPGACSASGIAVDTAPSVLQHWNAVCKGLLLYLGVRKTTKHARTRAPMLQMPAN